MSNPEVKPFSSEAVGMSLPGGYKEMTNSALVYESKCGGRGGELRGLSQWVQLCTSRDMEPK